MTKKKHEYTGNIYSNYLGRDEKLIKTSVKCKTFL